mmetsp:Transcript_86040/g.256691  ORF Transcript_86040/g.256691 Transcript_86040/m.256691 type:complete len:237 (-) Transcript_86040:550-1260(-)
MTRTRPRRGSPWSVRVPCRARTALTRSPPRRRRRRRPWWRRPARPPAARATASRTTTTSFGSATPTRGCTGRASSAACPSRRPCGRSRSGGSASCWPWTSLASCAAMALRSRALRSTASDSSPRTSGGGTGMPWTCARRSTCRRGRTVSSSAPWSGPRLRCTATTCTRVSGSRTTARSSRASRCPGRARGPAAPPAPTRASGAWRAAPRTPASRWSRRRRPSGARARNARRRPRSA